MTYPVRLKGYPGLILAFVCGLAILAARPAPAQVFDSRAPFAILVDADSGTVLYEKDADKLMSPASMAKLMLVEYVFHALKDGRLSMTDEFVISENAWRKGGASSGGSTMFAKLGSSVTLGDLLHGIIIQSGNDACIAIAEGLAGSEIAFSDLLNARAKEIGMKNSTFRNSTGLPDPDQKVTARDLAVLARDIILNYPEYYPIFAQPDFEWNGIKQRNRNPLLTVGIGADGLKTGYTEESGYGLVGSAVSNTQRLIVVINGMESSRARAEEARKLLEWGFRTFRQVTLFEADEVVAEGKVFGGTKGRVELKAKGPVRVLVSRSDSEALKGRAVYTGPIEAPIEPGTEVGALKIYQDERLIQETPLYTAETIGKGELHERALDALGELLLGWL
ncbi:MAG TPA: D-alanyl-D-alanine carboxypeptidase family protein [Afifellaceae bacterium]|nr:D-alanyl-D-alanine carboxypeptidase family protein [Afifellaceae bacterium]